MLVTHYCMSLAFSIQVMDHESKDKMRTKDVLLSESLTFSDLQLSKQVVEGLQVAGFDKPSPIQLKAIPLGRCGLGW